MSEPSNGRAISSWMIRMMILSWVIDVVAPIVVSVGLEEDNKSQLFDVFRSIVACSFFVDLVLLRKMCCVYAHNDRVLL